MTSDPASCRLCLASVEVNINLFISENGKEAIVEQISNMFQIEVQHVDHIVKAIIQLSHHLNYLTSFQIKEDKILSPLACTECVRELDHCRELRRKIATTQEILLALKPKAESPDKLPPTHLSSALPRKRKLRLKPTPPPPAEVKLETTERSSNFDEDDPIHRTTRGSDYCPDSDSGPEFNYGNDGPASPAQESVVTTRRAAKRHKIKEQATTINQERADKASPNSTLDEDHPTKRKTVQEIREEKAPMDKMMFELHLLECSLCGDPFTAFYQLNKHMKTKHRREGFIACCDQRFGPKTAHDHMKYHLDNEAFKCPHCGKFCTSNCSLRKHLETHSEGTGEHRCEECGKVFKGERLLFLHRRWHLPEDERAHQCRYCSRGFNGKTALTNHIRSAHQEGAHFVCEVCGKGGYASTTALQAHIKRHDQQKNEECDICGKFFFNVKVHKKRAHLQTEKIPCTECDRSYTKFNMPKHMKEFHSGIMNKCPYCPKEIRCRATYRVHVNLHLGVKYDCHFCPAQTSDPGNMYKHMQQHHPVEYGELKAKRNSVPLVRSGMK